MAALNLNFRSVVTFAIVVWIGLFSSCNGQYAQTTTTNLISSQISGTGAWATATHKWWVPDAANPLASVSVASTAAPAMPTMYWNCDVMPTICSNVRAWLLNTANTVPREFVYDIQAGGRTDARRGRMCPGKRVEPWKGLLASYRANPLLLPPLVWFERAGVMQSMNGQLLIPNTFIIREQNLGQNAASGIGYTCDEFPPASWVQGGVGNGPTLNRGTIIGAPQDATCGLAGIRPFRQAGGYVIAKSEQNWQSNAINALRDTLNLVYGNPDAAAFIFATTTLPAASRTTHAFIVYDTGGAAAPNPITIIRRNEENSYFNSSGHQVTPFPEPNTPTETNLSRKKIQVVRRAGIPENHEPDLADSESVIDEDDILDEEIETLRQVKREEKRRREEEDRKTLHQMELDQGSEADAPVYDPQLFETDEYLSILDPQLLVPDKRAKRANRGRQERQRLVGSDKGTWFNKDEASRIARLRKLSDAAKRASPREPVAVKNARRIVRAAQREAEARNAYVVANPRRNSPNGPRGDSPKSKRRIQPSRYKFTVNSIVADAAALVAQADAKAANTTETVPTLKPRAPPPNASLWWYEGIEHNGQFVGAPSGYKVYRNVKDYGAKGDGVTDDTQAINDAIREGNRCEANCGATSVLGAVVYFPAGTYLVSGSLLSDYYTVFIGDPNNRPILQASNSFVGFGIFASDFYDGGPDSHEWFINQNNFYRQIRNFVLDISQMPSTSTSCAIHWQVAQATSLHNIAIIMARDATNNHMGIFMENGSGGYLGDILFSRGNIGFYAGNQQFTTKNLVFAGCRTGIWSHWDWGWTWKSIYMSGVAVGLNMTRDPGGINPGSNLVLDSVFRDVGTVVLLESTTGINGTTMVILDNIVMQNCGIGVKASGSTLLAGGSRTIASWGRGRIYNDANPDGMLSSAGMDLTPLRRIDGSLLGPGSPTGVTGGIFERTKPQYTVNNAGRFTNVKDYGAYGDGVHDDTAALQRTLNLNCGIQYIFIPAGTYLITKTLKVPVGCIIAGEAWPQIMATGPSFQDMKKPYVAVRIGQPGDIGDIEITDVMFTTRGPTAGAVLVEWNVKAATQGSAGMWDCVIRVGGAHGSNLQASDCPKLTTSINNNCIAGSLLLRVTSQANGYFENVWGWTADHDIDSGPGQTQIDVYVARGFLIEGPGPTWLYATASEHNVLYQYQINNARNIWMGMIQTESPYFQGVPAAPTPFEDSLGQFPMDPPFNQCSGAGDWYTCGFSWAVRILGSTNVYLYGAGLYSWFQQYSQVCLVTESCQSRVLQIHQSTGVHIFNLMTKASLTMITRWNGHPAWAVDNHNAYGSTIAAWFLNQKSPTDDNGVIGPGGSYTQTLGDSIWSLRHEGPIYASCPIYPCTLSLPPATVSAPIQPPPITLTSAGKTTTITPPLVRSEVLSFSSFVISSVPTTGTTLTPILSGTNIPVPPVTFTTLGVRHTVVPPPLSIPFTATTYGNCSVFCDPQATAFPEHPVIVDPPRFRGSSNSTNRTSIFGDGLLGDDNGRGCSGPGCGCTGTGCGICHGPKCGTNLGCVSNCNVNTDGGCKGSNCGSGCSDKHCSKPCTSVFCGCIGLSCGGINFGLEDFGGGGTDLCFGPDCINGFCVGINCFPGRNEICNPAPCPCYKCVPPVGEDGEEEEEEEDEEEVCPLILFPPTTGTDNGDPTYEINVSGGGEGWKSPPRNDDGGGGQTTTGPGPGNGGPTTTGPGPGSTPAPERQRFELWARDLSTSSGSSWIEQWTSNRDGNNNFAACQFEMLDFGTMPFPDDWFSAPSPIEHLLPWDGTQECTFNPKSGLNWSSEAPGGFIGDMVCPSRSYQCVKPPAPASQQPVCDPAQNNFDLFVQVGLILCRR